MKLFDLHCDTAIGAYVRKQSFFHNILQIAFDRAEVFEDYTQVLAIFSEHHLSEEEAYDQFLAVCDYIDAQKPFPGFFHHLLGVEGGKLLAGKPERLDVLYQKGVRILTLVWSDSCCIGGAHNTDEGLTPFGFEVVKRCFDLGIVPDISHASDQMFWQVAALAKEAGKPFIASHSDLRAVRDHKRNLTDEMLLAVAESGGIVGISFCPLHLTDGEVADGGDIVKHILHAREVLATLDEKGKQVLCLGGDLDGTKLPEGFRGIQDIPKLAAMMADAGIPQEEIDGIFAGNAHHFFKSNNIALQ